MQNTQQRLKQLLKNEAVQQQLKQLVIDQAQTAAIAANHEGLRSQLNLLQELTGWGASSVLMHLEAQQAAPPTCEGIPVEKGQYFVNLKPQIDTDADDNERVTPPGHLWLISNVHEDGTIQAECEKTGGWISPSSEELASNFIPAPVVYDAGPDQVERYTVFPGQLGYGSKEITALQYLGCSEGGLSVSMFGELSASEAANGLDHLGEKVSFDALSEETRLHIARRLSKTH
ncbi:hypothetical protein [Halomonas sp. AOP42-D1-22]|uniref:hypothetical protein n=1 Tax=Halomonas sp. AOP42-D1-22 TaxID=3457667 RepID=UPI004034DD59